MRKKLAHGSDLDPGTKKNKYGLTPREEQFCQAYLIDFNIAKAARVAGYSENSGYSVIGKEKIQKRIAQIRLDTGKALDVTRERILQELMKIVYADPRTLFDSNGKRINPAAWDDSTASTIASVDIDLLGEIKSVKRWDKTKAIELLNKMLGYNSPDVVLNKNINYNSEQLNKEDVKNISDTLDKLL
jgi:phage terminase small subunit